MYILDRTNGTAVISKPFITTSNAYKGTDAKGQPIPDPEKEPSIGGVLASPDSDGAANFPAPSFNPETGLLYVNATEAHSIYYLTESDGKAIGWGGASEDSCGGLLSLSDASALASVSGVLRLEGQDYEIRQTRMTNCSDLRSHPTVLIGGLNNQWTLRLCSKLRFCFKFDNEKSLSEIVDNKQPGISWSLPKEWGQLPKNKVTQDYGLISRVFDPTTEQFVVIVAGIGAYGTTAAGEFLSKPKYVDLIAKQAPKDWGKKNLQIVISTQVINGVSGPPHIVATEFW